MIETLQFQRDSVGLGDLNFADLTLLGVGLFDIRVLDLTCSVCFGFRTSGLGFASCRVKDADY